MWRKVTDHISIIFIEQDVYLFFSCVKILYGNSRENKYWLFVPSVVLLVIWEPAGRRDKKEMHMGFLFAMVSVL